MSTSRVQTHRHWKKSPPSAHALALIRQVNYDLEFDEDDNDGMIDVYEVNILKPKHQSRSHWRRFPAAYFAFLKRILYRFELYIDVHDVINENRGDYSFGKDPIRMLKQYIQYMDGVIMEAWEQCRAAAVDDELGPDWRCPALDKWLCLEFHAKRHGIEDVERYIKESGAGLNEDPFEFGRLYMYYHVSAFTCMFGTDWTEYETSVPDWHHGEKYDYEIASMKEEDLRGMIPKVMRWLDNKPNLSDEDVEEDVGDEEKDVSSEEEDVSDDEEEEEVVVEVKGK